MAHPKYLREKAVQMRVERRMTIDQIAERLALSRTTIYYWVKDIPIPRRHFDQAPSMAARRRAVRAMQAKFKAIRDEAYWKGQLEFDELAERPGFREFICLYIAEGSKRNRCRVEVCNSDPLVVKLCHAWIAEFAQRGPTYQLQFHADQNIEELRRYWSTLLEIEPADIRMQRKSNSNQLSGRTWRSRFGVLAVGANDTAFRSRLQGWIDRMRLEWV